MASLLAWGDAKGRDEGPSATAAASVSVEDGQENASSGRGVGLHLAKFTSRASALAKKAAERVSTKSARRGNSLLKLGAVNPPASSRDGKRAEFFENTRHMGRRS